MVNLIKDFLYPPRPLSQRLKTVGYWAKIRARQAALPFYAFKMYEDLSRIQAHIASKEGELTETECAVLCLATTRLNVVSQDWWKGKET